MNTCSVCQQVKPPEAFYVRNKATGARETWCIPCRLAKNKAWAESNRDYQRSLTRRWYAENKDTHLENSRAWYASNRHRKLATTTAREKRCAIATPKWADKELIASTYWMAQFLSFAVGRQYHVDHIVPLQSKKVCGLHTHANLSIVPAQENWSKFNTTWPDMA
jgi:hypothetical protein